MRGNIKKIISIIIILNISLYAYLNYENKKYDSIRILGNGDNKYFALSVKNNRQEKLRDFIFTTYDKENRKKAKYDFEKNYGYIVNIPILSASAKACGNWLILKTVDCNKLLGINADTGQVRELVELEEEKGQYLLNFDLYGDKVVYSYNEDDLVKVSVKNINTDEIQYVGDFFSKDEIPLSIYEDKVALIKKNDLYIYDCRDNNFTVIKGSKYQGNLLLSKDEIYTFKKADNGDSLFDLVQVDLNNKREKIILHKVPEYERLELDGEKVFFNEYFYDLGQDKLYYKESDLGKSYIEGRLILGNYIKGRDNRYEKIEYNKNCFEYTLGVDRYSSYKIEDKERYVEVLLDGQVIVTGKNTTKVEKRFDGFNLGERRISWNFALDEDKLYGIDISEDGKAELVYINIKDGSKNIIKELGKDIGYVMNLSKYCNEIMYSIKRDNDEIVKIIDTDNLNEIEYDLVKEENIHDMFFNKEYISYMVGGSKPSVIIHDRKSNEIKNSENEDLGVEYYGILGINNNGIMLESNDNKCEFVDFKFNIKKEFNNKDNAIKYMKK